MGTPGETWDAAVEGDGERADEPSYGIALATRLPVRSWHTVGPSGPMTMATTHLSFVPGWNVWQLRKVCRELPRLRCRGSCWAS